MFIQEYALSLELPCPNCPTNARPRTLSEIDTIIDDLVTNQHVGVFREIVPLELLSPSGMSDPSGTEMQPDTDNYAPIDAVLDVYKKHNVSLILAIGNPVPAWAAPWGNHYACFLPPIADSADFNTLRNNIAWTVGNYLNHLNAIGYSLWMAGVAQGEGPAGGIFVEGFSEWNSNASYKNCNDLSVATPERAAALENAISWVAKFYGVKVNLAAPSIVFPNQGLGGWYTAYYAANGTGAPSVHIFGNGSASPKGSDAAIKFAKSQLKDLVSVLPQQYRKSIIWGETGFGETNSVCSGTSSLPTKQWAEYDAAAAKLVSGVSSIGADAVQLLTVWRLDQLENQTSCEGYYGIVSSDGRYYLPPAIKMFRYLGGSGVMGKGR